MGYPMPLFLTITYRMKKIKERYEDDPNVVDDIVDLIHRIGSYNVRMALDLITDDEIDELDED